MLGKQTNDDLTCAIERQLLPAPEFKSPDEFTRVHLYGPKPFKDMRRPERLHPVYLYTCLNYISNRETTNSTIWERFGFDDTLKASRLLADAVEAGRSRVANTDVGRRFAHYVPHWA